jgi:hypothetical protein
VAHDVSSGDWKHSCPIAAELAGALRHSLRDLHASQLRLRPELPEDQAMEMLLEGGRILGRVNERFSLYRAHVMEHGCVGTVPSTI